MTVIEGFLAAAMDQPITVQVYDALYGGILFAGDDRHIVLQMTDGLKLINVEDITAIDVKQSVEITVTT